MEIIAHRGIHGNGVFENSLEAIKNVIDSGADGVEFDVRLTLDGQCVLAHDTKTINKLRISATNYELIRDDVALLRDVLYVLGDYKGLINIEIKHLFFERDHNRGFDCALAVVSVLKEIYGENIPHNIVVSSFSYRNLKVVREQMPQVNVAYLVPHIRAFFYTKNRCLEVSADAIHMSAKQAKMKLFTKVIAYARQNNIKVRCYTVNTKREAIELEARGIDGIFTDKVYEFV